MRTHRLAALAVVFPFVFSACPNPSAVPAPSASVCTRIADQCKLPNGVLGVCESSGVGEARLACMPQH